MSGAAQDTALGVRQQAWHQSSVKELTAGCPHKWKLRYVDGLDDPSGWPAVVGTSVHAAVEAHEQERIDARREHREPRAVSEDEMVAAAHAELEANDAGEQHDYGDGRPYNLETAKAAIATAVGHWWHQEIPAGQPGAGGTIRERLLAWTPVAVEPHFRVWLAGLSKPMGGWIDGVYLDDQGRWVLVDSKTADNYGRWPTDGSVTRLQPAQYALGASLACNLPMWELPRFEFQIMRTRAGSNSRFEGVRVIGVEPDTLDVEGVKGQMREAEAIALAGVFPPEPERMGPLCSARWCSFFEAPGSPCPARPHPGEVAAWSPPLATPVRVPARTEGPQGDGTVVTPVGALPGDADDMPF